MKKDLPILLFLGLITSLVYFKTFGVFFAQDDFILINQFSQNGIFRDLQNVFGLPEVTHWRPVQNLYFLIAGNIFDKNYFGYHIFTFLLHITGAFFVYKLIFRLLGKKGGAVFGSLIYAISPVHFVSLTWISGNATLIAFLFFIISFYLYINYKKGVLPFYLLSLLSSEAFIACSVLYVCWDYTFGQKFKKQSLIYIMSAFVFVFIKVIFFTPAETYDTYQADFSLKIFSTLKYYLLRIAGFAESSGDLPASLMLAIVIFLMLFVLARNFKQEKKVIIFSLSVLTAGLFPFVLLKDHASAHYMSLSLFGFSLLSAAAYLYSGRKTQIVLIAAFTILYSYSVNLTYSNSWVVKRSLIAKSYIDKIKANNLDKNSRILFAGDDLNASEAYYSLGGGEALGFFFKEKNYNVCFEVFENCKALP